MPLIQRALDRLFASRRAEPVEAKASATGALIAMQTMGQPVWSPRDYGSFAREGYQQNAIVHRSVRMVAEAAASIPLLVYEGDSEVEVHPLVELLRRPSQGMTSTDLFEQWYGFLLVSGNAYMEAVALDGVVRELHALRPDRMRIVPGADGWPEAWEYEVAGRVARFAEDVREGVRPILHMRLFHPTNDHYGMSPIEAAATAIDIHNEAARWNKALLDNAARPSGALVYAGRDGSLTGEQFERLKRELETSYQGSAHAGRPLLLEGGLDWKPLSLSPKDMDFMEAKNGAAREIALALGVPPMLLGIPGDNTYSNYQEAQRAFWRQTVLPLVARTARALSSWLSPAYGGGLELRADLDQVEALSGEREALWARLEAASFLSRDEKRAAAGYGEGGRGREGKYSPDQPRVPAGNPAGGQWTSGGGGGGEADPLTAIDWGQLQSEAEGLDDLLHLISRRRGGPSGSPAQEMRLSIAARRARIATRKVEELDPTWRAPDVAAETIEGRIRGQETVAQAAEARYAEIVRSAIPGFNPTWGVNRLRKELYDRGYTLESTSRSPGGLIFSNAETGERVRIMPRPEHRRRSDPPEKFYFSNYYRYRPGPRSPEAYHVPIPDKSN